MNKDIVSGDVYEQYVDATVALFMEYYSAVTLPDRIRTEFESQGNNPFSFPAELDSRCRFLIKKECARHRRKQCVTSIVKGLRYVAALAVAALSLFSLLFITVEAFRVPIINYYIEQNDGHWDLSGQGNYSPEMPNYSLEINDPLAGLVSEEYQLVITEGESLQKLTAIYEDVSGRQVFFSCEPGNSLVSIDSEGAERSEMCKIGDCDAVLVIKNGVRLAWIHEETSTIFTLIADDLTETEVFSIASQIVYLISQ